MERSELEPQHRTKAVNLPKLKVLIHISIPGKKMIPQQYESKTYVLKIPFGKFAVTVVSLPFFSFIFCVIWSVLYFYERSTATHCGVTNFLPSISAAIGNYQPQRFIWQCAILLQALPRLLVAQQYLRHNSIRIRRSRRVLAYLAFMLNLIENFALVGLSLWNSSDFYGSFFSTSNRF